MVSMIKKLGQPSERPPVGIDQPIIGLDALALYYKGQVAWRDVQLAYGIMSGQPILLPDLFLRPSSQRPQEIPTLSYGQSSAPLPVQDEDLRGLFPCTKHDGSEPCGINCDGRLLGRANELSLKSVPYEDTTWGVHSA